MDSKALTPLFTNNIVSFPSLPKEPPKLHSTVVKDCTARAIKDTDVLQAIKSRLLTTGVYGLRNYTIFTFAINTGLRMGDILTLRLSDVYDIDAQKVKPTVKVYEEKTSKTNEVFQTQASIAALQEYIPTIRKEPDAPLFPSQKNVSHTHRQKDASGCLNVRSYWRILHSIATELGVEHLSCHSTRKTYAYTVYQTYKGKLINGEYSALDYIQQRLNHSSTKTTLRYIGIGREADEAVAQSINI